MCSCTSRICESGFMTKIVYRFNTILIILPMTFLTKVKKTTLKFIVETSAFQNADLFTGKKREKGE